MIKSLFSIFTKSEDSFEGEETGEKVVLLVRRHPFFIIMRLILLTIIFVIPQAVYNAFYPLLYSYNLTVLFFFVYSIWCLLVWSAAFYSLTMYTLDVWIVTDRRIIDSTQNGFFNRTVSELHLSRVQDTSVETKGFIQTFFKFGDVQVQTAGAQEKFNFSQIPNPGMVKDEIMKLALIVSK